MKRIVYGGVLLVLLLGLGVLFSVMMEDIHTPLADDLLEAAEAALEDNWEQAGTLFRAASASWERHKHFIAALADHSPMDDIDGLFGELEIYLQQQELPHFAAVCRHLARLAEGMGENHALNWWNLL